MNIYKMSLITFEFQSAFAFERYFTTLCILYKKNYTLNINENGSVLIETEYLNTRLNMIFFKSFEVFSKIFI